MKFLDRRRLINALLISSVILNILMLVYLAQSGGLRRFFMKMDLAELPKTRQAFQKVTEERYRKLPSPQGQIIFAGDSLIGDGPWAEFYSEIHNRGIGGDTAAGVLSRIDEVLEDRPRKLVLLIGANDLAAALPDSQFLRHYQHLLERIRKESPETQITVLSVLPVNETCPVPPTYDNVRVVETNRKLKAMVAEFPGVQFLDLTANLVGKDGRLRREFTVDGMHLTIDGYLAIRETLKKTVLEEASKP